MSHPDFLCIGPPKTGTTWLYVHLKNHPEIWLPPVKEISYLWGYDQRVFSTEKLQAHRRYVSRKKINHLKAKFSSEKFWPLTSDWQSFAWDIKYIFRPESVSWYRSLYSQREALIKGDISPQYHFLDDYEIKKIKQLNPKMKIIILLRHPVDRLWSLAKMKLVSTKSMDQHKIDEDLCIKFINQGLEECRSYWQMINSWQSNFPSVFIGYYEDLKNDPVGLFKQVVDFLDVSHHPELFDRKALKTPVWEGTRIEMPKNIRNYLIDSTKQSVMELFDRCGHPYVEKWLEDYSIDDS